MHGGEQHSRNCQNAFATLAPQPIQAKANHRVGEFKIPELNGPAFCKMRRQLLGHIRELADRSLGPRAMPAQEHARFRSFVRLRSPLDLIHIRSPIKTAFQRRNCLCFALLGSTDSGPRRRILSFLYSSKFPSNHSTLASPSNAKICVHRRSRKNRS